MTTTSPITNIHGRTGGRGIRPFLLIPKILGFVTFVGGFCAVLALWLSSDFTSLDLQDPRRTMVLHQVSHILVYLIVPAATVTIVFGVLLLLQHPRVFLSRRWMQVKLIALLIVASGVLGDVRSLVADHTQKLSDDPAHRLNALELGGGALLDLGIYPISFAWDLFGEPTTIQSTAVFRSTGADAGIAVQFGYESRRIASTFSASDTAGPNRATVLGTKACIEIDPVWYTPTSFRVVAPDGAVLEEYRSEVVGRGMHFQAEAFERLVAEGRLDGGDVLSIEESVKIMGTLDRIRAEIGLRYPGED